MAPEIEAKIKAFVRERDQMLMANDIERMLVFHQKHSPNIPVPSREVAQVSIHKARTAVKSLPIEARLLSARWLIERNYSTMDDGELTNQE